MNIEEKKKEISESEEKTENQEEKKEESAFVDFIVTGEERAASPGMSYGSNGAIVPTTIAKKIIEKVGELSPIYEKVEKFNTKGTLEIPVYGADTGVDSPTGDVNVGIREMNLQHLSLGKESLLPSSSKATHTALCRLSAANF